MGNGNGDGGGFRIRDGGMDRAGLPSGGRRPGVIRLVLLWWAVSAPVVALLLFVDMALEVSPLLFGEGESEAPTKVDVGPLVAGHLIGGAGAGVTLSTLWSRVGSSWAAAAAGFVAAIPFFLAIRIAVVGSLGWTLEGVLGLGMRALLGVALGLILWRGERAR